MIRPPSAALVGFLLVATGTLTAQAPPPAPAVPASAGNGVPGRHAEEGRPFIREYAPIELGGAGPLLRQAGHAVRECPVEGAGHFWFSEEPPEEPGSFAAFLAPRLLRFLKRHI